jgi:uncharacterized protein
VNELTKEGDTPAQTASQAGWRASHYNIWARIPNDEQGRLAVVNLYGGSCGAYSTLELAALTMLDELPANHPAVVHLARRGLIVNFDERAALEAQSRATCAHPGTVGLTISPTMGCNFDCPYCFEDHAGGRMTPEVQDDVVALAVRMMEAAQAKKLSVTWFGGEPLLVPDIIASLSARLVALAEERGACYAATAITNGYLLTPKVTAMLEQARVSKLQVTLDGLGATHDATRHLADGGGTFERIVQNLSRPGLPFEVAVRNNVHQSNQDEVTKLRTLVNRIAAESGNNLKHYSALVLANPAAEHRGSHVGLVDGHLSAEVLLSETPHATGRNPVPCGACRIFDVGIDPEGRLQKCWEATDKPELSFGNARDWDPADPFATASQPDNLTRFLNCAQPLADDECGSCLWLPLCAGGCPYRRLIDGKRRCLPYKDAPDQYALALWRGMEQDGES